MQFLHILKQQPNFPLIPLPINKRRETLDWEVQNTLYLQRCDGHSWIASYHRSTHVLKEFKYDKLFTY